MKRSRSAILIHILITLYLGLPILATFLFSIAGDWSMTILPESYTGKYYVQMVTDQDVLRAIGRSFLVSGATVFLSLLAVTPATFVVYLYYPKLRNALRFLALLPYALPGVILAVGLIQVYSSGFLPIAGTFWILLFAYVITCLPYVYNALVNSLQAINAKTLMEAAESLGASRMQAFLKVILPNILPGLISAGLLTFAVALGEFVLANMLVGGRFATLQLLLEKAMHVDGHLSSAMVMLYFALVAISSLVMMAVVQGTLGARVRGGSKSADSRVNTGYGAMG